MFVANSAENGYTYDYGYYHTNKPNQASAQVVAFHT
jgi:hypothetical protein